jgi:predicted ribonuclease YlaK
MFMVKHWQHVEYVTQEVYDKFVKYSIPIETQANLPYNTAVYIECINGGKRLEGIYDPELKAIRKLNLKGKTAGNRDLRLYLDAIHNPNITMIAVDGLMGTGKTSTAVEEVINQHLLDVKIPAFIGEDYKPDPDAHKVIIAKPYVNAGGKYEQYGFLPGDIDDKMDPTLSNFIQYFDRFHPAGFNKLREAGYIEIKPLGFIRGLDARNMTIIADETQNTTELISLATRKAENCRIFFLGDTSPFQIDLPGNTPKKNGLRHIIDLLQGAPYFQYIEMKTLEHIVRSDEVRDIVRRLFKKYGQDPQEWVI